VIRSLAVVVGAALGVACSGGDRSTERVDSGGGDQPMDAPAPDLQTTDGPFLDWPGACDPTDQNCAPGDECVVDCAMKQFRCVPSTPGPDQPGDPCSVTSCAKGLFCRAPPGGSMKCFKFCREDTDCPTGKTCTLPGVKCPVGEMLYGRFCTI